mgnify:CR=1 FL=1
MKVFLSADMEGTCGIAAGARPVLLAFMDEINKRGLLDVTVAQTGCIGMCRLEPIASSQWPQKAQRPVYSVLDNSKLSEFLGKKPRPWPQALRDFLFSEYVSCAHADKEGTH